MTRPPLKGMTPPDPVEGMARALVIALFPALEAALMSGEFYHHAAERLLAIAFPMWVVQHGQPVADAAAANLRRINCATVLTPYGLELWMREYPFRAIPKLPPPEASGGAPGRRRQFWDWLCRLRPASRA